MKPTYKFAYIVLGGLLMLIGMIASSIFMPSLVAQRAGDVNFDSITCTELRLVNANGDTTGRLYTTGSSESHYGNLILLDVNDAPINRITGELRLTSSLIDGTVRREFRNTGQSFDMRWFTLHPDSGLRLYDNPLGLPACSLSHVGWSRGNGGSLMIRRDADVDDIMNTAEYFNYPSSSELQY